MSDYWKQYEGKSVRLKDLLQWLSDEHDHVTDDEGELLDGWDHPVVNSMALHRWAIAEASADEYEYNIETLDLVTGHTHIWRERWEADTEWLQRKLDERNAYDRKLLNIPGGGPLEYTHRLVKRRKAGGIEDV